MKWWGVVLLLFFVIVSPSLAAFDFSIASVEPTSVSSKIQEVTVKINITDLPSESYFRVSWQESDGKPYFGYVLNNDNNWIKIKSLGDDGCKDYFKISDTSTTSAILKAKIGEDTDVSPGTYNLKVHRFTSGCSYSNIVPSTQMSLIFPTPVSSPTSQPTPTPTAGTATPTPTPRPTPSASAGRAKPSPTPLFTMQTPDASSAAEEFLATPMVLSDQTESSPSPTPTSTGPGFGIGLALVIAGGLSLLIVGWIIWKRGQQIGVDP